MKKSVLALLVIFVSMLSAQMVPHPNLLEKIKNGEINIPYALKNYKELKERGVSTGWTSEELTKQNSIMKKEDIHRTYGPAKAASGEFNAIFLFVEFSDQESQVSVSFFDDLLFANTASSMWGYFDEVTYGNLDLITADMPSTIGWVTMPNTYDYYVGGENGFGNFPANAQGLTRDVVQLVDPYIDFSLYDNDGDGEIEALFIVHTGPGAEYTGSDDDIWSHAWAIPGGYMTDDGVEAYRYSMEPEYWSTPGDMTIGVYAHEMGHSVFGLPDVYDTDYTSNGVGRWSLMAGGSWNGNNGATPAWPDAWNHIQMGYFTPTNVTTDLIGETITAMTTEADIYKIWKDGNPGSQYFLVQNRQRTKYDAGIPGSGLLIWHIDETKNGNSQEWYPGNTNSGNYLVALEQADNNYDLEKGVNSGDTRDPFPGQTNNIQFNFLSSPSSNAYNGTSTYVSVENISASGNEMTADLKISQPAEYLQVASPNGGESWQGSSSKTIQWSSNGVNEVDIELSIDNGSTWTVIEEDLDASTGEYEWVVPNTPSAECLIKVTDSGDNSNIDESNSTFTITAAPVVEVMSPNGGEEFKVGEQVEITWTSASVTSVKIQYSTDNGNTWQNVIVITPSDGSYNWTVPDKPSEECLVKIIDISNGNVVDESDDVFTIMGSAALQLMSPNGGEVYLGGETVEITWSSSNVENVKIEYSMDNGSSWNVIVSETESNGSYDWVLPDEYSNEVLVRITDASNGTLVDQSDDVFTINSTTSVEEESIPLAYSLEQNYPNPFNPSTQIKFGLPFESNVKLRIFNILGQTIAELVNQSLQSGYHTFEWNAGNLTSGIYFYSIEANSINGDKSFNSVKKMLLVK
ncbi:MAG: M6 family metalloprotease domain-containing protein [Ignavibacteriales bacterium]|nr:MAG: M6 family metalloprotease domain-containing protein [Ignavibacteriales bacterium]